MYRRGMSNKKKSIASSEDRQSLRSARRQIIRFRCSSRQKRTLAWSVLPAKLASRII